MPIDQSSLPALRPATRLKWSAIYSPMILRDRLSGARRYGLDSTLSNGGATDHCRSTQRQPGSYPVSRSK